jgi:hypothetical protein
MEFGTRRLFLTALDHITRGSREKVVVSLKNMFPLCKKELGVGTLVTEFQGVCLSFITQDHWTIIIIIIWLVWRMM